MYRDRYERKQDRYEKRHRRYRSPIRQSIKRISMLGILATMSVLFYEAYQHDAFKGMGLDVKQQIAQKLSSFSSGSPSGNSEVTTGENSETDAPAAPAAESTANVDVRTAPAYPAPSPYPEPIEKSGGKASPELVAVAVPLNVPGSGAAGGTSGTIPASGVPQQTGNGAAASELAAGPAGVVAPGTAEVAVNEQGSKMVPAHQVAHSSKASEEDAEEVAETAGASSSEAADVPATTAPASTMGGEAASGTPAATAQAPAAVVSSGTPVMEQPPAPSPMSAVTPPATAPLMVSSGEAGETEVVVDTNGAHPQKSAGGPTFQRFIDFLDFDSITPEWVTSRWSNVLSVGPLYTRGYRVPLCTGSDISDLIGSLTYYFDRNLELEKITFEGYTGDLDRLILTLKHFNMSKRTTSDPNILLYETPKRKDGTYSYMKSYFRTTPMTEGIPNTRYHIVMELYPREAL